MPPPLIPSYRVTPWASTLFLATALTEMSLTAQTEMPDISLPDYPSQETDGSVSAPSPGLDAKTPPAVPEPAGGGIKPGGVVLPPPTMTLSTKGKIVEEHGEVFIKRFVMEVLSSTREWRARWTAPDFGFLRVGSFSGRSALPHGHLISWQHDRLGNPSLHLVMRLFLPKLSARDPLGASEPWSQQSLRISQNIACVPRGSDWLALASPIQVELESATQPRLLLESKAGCGLWQAVIGAGGLWIDGLAEAGLAGCRELLPAYFRDEEIRLFLQGNSDAIFYLRPTEGKP